MSKILTARDRAEALLNDYFRTMSAGQIRRQATNLCAEIGDDVVREIFAILDESAAEQERIRCIYAAMPARTDEQLEEILANSQAEFHVRAAAADVQRSRRS